MLCGAPPGHPLQKRTVVQWDIDGVLSADYAADESVSPQFGIRQYRQLLTLHFLTQRSLCGEEIPEGQQTYGEASNGTRPGSRANRVGWALFERRVKNGGLRPWTRPCARPSASPLRVCPKTSGGITKFSEHEAD